MCIRDSECIDCGVCEPECPVEAIIPDNMDDNDKWLELNEKYANIWPNISRKREEDVPADVKDWEGVKGKMEYFSDAPGKGD